jgi:hypothetical protein
MVKSFEKSLYESFAKEKAKNMREKAIESTCLFCQSHIKHNYVVHSVNINLSYGVRIIREYSTNCHECEIFRSFNPDFNPQ